MSFQTFEYGFPDAPKDQRIRGVNVVRDIDDEDDDDKEFEEDEDGDNYQYEDVE